MSDLRSLAFSIGWTINDAALRQSDAMTDLYRDNVLGLQTDMEGLSLASDLASTSISEGMGSAQSQMELFGETSAAASMQVTDGMSEAQHEIKELGEQGKKTTESLDQGLQNVNSSLLDMVENAQQAFDTLKGGIGALVAGGVLGFFTRAAAGAEATQLRFEWFASETEGALDKLNSAMDATTEMSRGLLTEGDLQAAAIQAMQLGTSADFISDHMQAAAIISAKSGQQISSIMQQLGRAVEMGSIEPLRNLGIITEEHFAMVGEKVTGSIANWDRSKRELLVYAATQDLVNSNMDMYNNYLDTSEAQTKIFNNQLGEVVETMGGPLLRPLNQVLWSISSLFKEIKENPVGDFALQMLGWIISLGALGAGFLFLGKALGFVWQMALPMLVPFLKFIAIASAVYLIVEDLIFAFFDLGDSVTESLFDSLMELMGFNYSFQQFREDIINNLNAVGDYFVLVWVWIKQAWGEGEGWLADTVLGMGSILFGLFEMMNGVASIALGLLVGIFSGNWTLLLDGIDQFLGSGETIWGGIQQMFAKPMDWVTDKIEEWKDLGLQKVDELIQGFLNMPGTILAGIEDFGSQLKNKISEQLSDVRRLLPFSPAKEGPLVDLHESGENIIGNIQEGINRANALNITGKLTPARDQIAERSFDSSPRVPQAGGESVVFSPTIQVSISGGTSADVESQIRQAKEVVRREFIPMLEEYFRMMKVKSPRTIES